MAWTHALAGSLALLIAGCAAPAPQPGVAADFPPTLRPALHPQWIDAAGHVTWPPNDGCATPAVAIVLPPGMVIDRFGAEGGSFFSAPDQSFAARAMPYICPRMAYTVYRVKQPIPAQACPAAPWFGEPGGAPQFKTPHTVAALLAAGSIEADPAATLRAGAVCRGP